MRLFVSGSAPLLSETHQAFRQRTGHEIVERYGMTETLMNTSNPYDGMRKPGSVGPPLPGIDIRVGLSGRAGVSARDPPNVFAGYWQDPEKTRSEFTDDGWFKTGDLGRIDGDGYVHIVGRAKDLVISGGYNVYPKEVEMELDALPGVLESAVFGVPHPDFGEGVTAVVVLRPAAALTEAEVISAIQSRLARYKVPKRVLFVDELPRNAMAKVQKNLLRARYAGLYGAAPDRAGDRCKAAPARRDAGMDYLLARETASPCSACGRPSQRPNRSDRSPRRSSWPDYAGPETPECPK